MKPPWSELLDTLRELHEVAPDYRFGQLICNLASLAGGSEVVSVWDVDDDDLVVAARRFLETHPRFAREDVAGDDLWPALTARLQQLGEEYPGVRFGQMIGYLATAVRGPEAGAMWDVEDDELLAVADRWLEHRRTTHEAEAELHRMLHEFEAERE